MACALALALGASPARPAGLSVEGGATVSPGTGTLDLGCTDLAVSGTFAGGSGLVAEARDVAIKPGGTLDGGSATFRVAGDWTNSGLFASGTSGVEFVDGCGRTSATISGPNGFFDFTMSTSEGKLYAFQASSIQKVDGALTLEGAPGKRLQIRSTLDGTVAALETHGSQSVSFVDVKDNQAVGNQIYYGPDSSSLGNTPGWVFLGIPVPALGPWALVLLTASLTTASALVLRRRASAG
jgi:hypothetical protein